MVEGREMMRDVIQNNMSRKVGGLVKGRFRLVSMTYVDTDRGGSWGRDVSAAKSYINVVKRTVKGENEELDKNKESFVGEQIKECKREICSLTENIELLRNELETVKLLLRNRDAQVSDRGEIRTKVMQWNEVHSQKEPEDSTSDDMSVEVEIEDDGCSNAKTGDEIRSTRGGTT